MTVRPDGAAAAYGVATALCSLQCIIPEFCRQYCSRLQTTAPIMRTIDSACRLCVCMCRLAMTVQPDSAAAAYGVATALWRAGDLQAARALLIRLGQRLEEAPVAGDAASMVKIAAGAQQVCKYITCVPL